MKSVVLILKDDAFMDAKNIMKKQPTWGGFRKNSGRKPNKKTGTKIVWLGLRWEPEELKTVLAAIMLIGTEKSSVEVKEILNESMGLPTVLRGIKNKSHFVTQAAVKEARMVLKKSNYLKAFNNCLWRTLD